MKVFFCCRYGGESLSEDHSELSITLGKLARSLCTFGWALGHQTNGLDIYVIFQLLRRRNDIDQISPTGQTEYSVGPREADLQKRKATGEQ